MKNKINFVPDGAKNDNNEQPIVCKFNYGYIENGRNIPLNFSTGETVDSIYWDYKEKRIKKNAPVQKVKRKEEINNTLRDIEYKVFKIIDDYKREFMAPPAPSYIKETLLNGRPKKNPNNVKTSVVDFANKLVIEKQNNDVDGKKGITESSMRTYKTAIKKMVEYQTKFKKTLVFEDLNKVEIEKFLDFCKNYVTDKTDEKLKTNSIYNIQVFFRLVINAAKKDNIKVGIESTVVPIVTRPINKTIYLTLDQLKQLDQLKKVLPTITIQLNKLRHVDLEVVKDLLLISSWTGIRFGDIETNPTIKPVGKTNFLSFTQKKTGVALEIPVFPPVMKIYKKYKNSFPKPIELTVYNAGLKELGKLMGWCKTVGISDMRLKSSTKELKVNFCDQLSSHVGRRSFATNLSQMGFAPNEIMRFTGHKSLEVFLRYIQASQVEQGSKLHSDVVSRIGASQGW